MSCPSGAGRSAVDTAALIPLGYPLGKFGRPGRRPLREMAFADRWGQAF